MMDLDDSGGFIQPGLLSPAPTSRSSTSTVNATLPYPRSQPLKLGGSKESSFIRFVDQSIQNIQRRYANRAEGLQPRAGVATNGYKSFVEVEQDMSRLIDLIWVSGTRKNS